jgi:anti-sigma-K factor RskA
MDCRKTRKIIGQYLSDALSEKARGAFEEHVASCAGCRAEVGRYEAAYGLLERVGEISPSADFQRRLNARIRRSHTEAARRSPVRVWRRVPVWARAAAAVAACVAIGLALWFSLQPTPTQKPGGQPGLSAQEEQEIVENLDLLENLPMLQAAENGDIKVYGSEKFDAADVMAESNIDTSDINKVAYKEGVQNK